MTAPTARDRRNQGRGQVPPARDRHRERHDHQDFGGPDGAGGTISRTSSTTRDGEHPGRSHHLRQHQGGGGGQVQRQHPHALRRRHDVQRAQDQWAELCQPERERPARQPARIRRRLRQRANHPQRREPQQDEGQRPSRGHSDQRGTSSSCRSAPSCSWRTPTPWRIADAAQPASFRRPMPPATMQAAVIRSRPKGSPMRRVPMIVARMTLVSRRPGHRPWARCA